MTALFKQLVGHPIGITTRSLALATILGATLHSAVAQSVYQTGFEQPLFAPNFTLAGQDGWIAPPPFSPDAAVVTTDKPRIGKQTVRVLGSDLVHQDFINEATGGYYDAIGSYRHAVNHNAAGGKVVQVSAYVRVDGAKTRLGNNFFSAGIAARATLANGDTAGVGELAISSDGHVYGYSGNEDVPTLLTSTRVELGQWHNLTVVVDFGARKFSFIVDHKCEGEFAFDANNVDENGTHIDYTTVLARGSLLAYAAPDAGPLLKANYAAHYDAFSITAKPIKHKREQDDCDDRDDQGGRDDHDGRGR